MIDILLPTYNGGQYLPTLLNSILNQSYKDVHIIVRDDGSKDNTCEIIQEYKKKYPEKFYLIEDGLGNQGTSGSNDLLIRHVTSKYFMYCDQDDIWMPTKIEETLVEMKRLEILYPQKPILVCTDAECFDKDDRVIAPSFYKSQHFQDVTDDCHKLLALNVVQGATAMMNCKVLDYMTFIPHDLFHDWWTAVITSRYGKVSYIHKPLLRYRQHSSNVVGANNIGLRYMTEKLIHLRRQMCIYASMYYRLPFHPNILKWAYYKIIINLRRL